MKTRVLEAVFLSLTAVLAFSTPTVGWTADHLLTLTGITTSVCPTPGVTQTQAAVVNGTSGAVSQALILSGLQGNGTGCGSGSLNSVSFTGTLTLVRANVKLCKPGTGGQFEWLDQGSAVVGANGNLSGTSGQVAYSVAFSSSALNVSNVSGPCPGQANQYNFSITNSATVSKETTQLATASFAVPNASTLPEPGTLLLLGIGLLAIGWTCARTRQGRYAPLS